MLILEHGNNLAQIISIRRDWHIRICCRKYSLLYDF